MTTDLHLHTKVSDGLLTPTELVRKAAEEGLHIIAVTDHDSTGGLDEAIEAAEKLPQVTLVPGVELSTDVADGEIHILGYFNDIPEAEFQEKMAEFREARIGRARGMIDKLAALDMPLDWDRVQEIAGDGSIGRPHIALALQERGYIETVAEAFDKYIGRTGPAYVERYKLEPYEAIALIRDAGGLPTFAHPLNKDSDISNTDTEALKKTVRDLAQAGLIGVEVYYGRYTSPTRAFLLELAKENGLLALGGSDYHGEGIGADVPLGSSQTPLEVGQELLDALEEILQERLE